MNLALKISTLISEVDVYTAAKVVHCQYGAEPSLITAINKLSTLGFNKSFFGKILKIPTDAKP